MLGILRHYSEPLKLISTHENQWEWVREAWKFIKNNKNLYQKSWK